MEICRTKEETSKSEGKKTVLDYLKNNQNPANRTLLAYLMKLDEPLNTTKPFHELIQCSANLNTTYIQVERVAEKYPELHILRKNIKDIIFNYASLLDDVLRFKAEAEVCKKEYADYLKDEIACTLNPNYGRQKQRGMIS